MSRGISTTSPRCSPEGAITASPRGPGGVSGRRDLSWPCRVQRGKRVSLEEAFQWGNERNQVQWGEGILSGGAKGKSPAGRPPEPPSGRMIQPSTGAVQLLGVRADLKGSEEGICEIKVKAPHRSFDFFLLLSGVLQLTLQGCLPVTWLWSYQGLWKSQQRVWSECTPMPGKFPARARDVSLVCDVHMLG